MADTPTKIVGGAKAFATCSVSSSTSRQSNIIDIGGGAVRSVQMSTAWTNATLTFEGAVDSTSNMSSLRHTTAGIALTYATTASRILAIDPNLTAGLRYIRVHSSATQATTRNLILGITKVDH